MRPSLVLATVVALTGGVADAGDIPTVSLLREAPAGFKVRLAGPSSSAFNAPGNLLIGQSGRSEGSADLLLELAADGATVWECRLAPAGTLSGFFRAADGTTLVTQCRPGAWSRMLVLDRQGSFRRGWSVRSRGSEPPPAITAAQLTADGSVAASVAGYAFAATRQGRLTLQWAFGKLKSAMPLADGRWLAALSRPERFAIYDPATRGLASLPLDGFCHVWSADRAEQPGPDLLRLYGCFCMPSDGPTDHGVRPRLTIEVADTTLGGGLLATFGSPRALRVDEFGTERCATFTRGIVRLASGGMIVVNTYPMDCRVEEHAADGSVVRTILAAAAAGGGGTFGENACPLVGIQQLVGAAPAPPVRPAGDKSGGTIFP